MKVFLCFLFFLFSSGSGKNIKCIHRDYGYGSSVCVCNSTYCDTIEPLGPFSEDEYNLYTSSQSGLRFHYTKSKFEAFDSEKDIQITVNPKIIYQKIHGFGGAFTDSACLNIKTLNKRAKEKLLESYFSPKGIEYSLGRVPIGGTDFSTRKYTLDDNPGDTQLKKFSLSSEDKKLKIPIILQSQRVSKRSIRLVASAWTAPPWMKTNKDYICFGLLQTQFYDLWGQYHLKFLEEYNKHGVKIWAVTTGNEPTAGLLPYYSFNCMGWTPFSQSRWVSQNLGPQLHNSTFRDTLIIAVDDNRYTLPWWPKIMFTNEKTKEYVSGVGVHWYWDNYTPLPLLDWTHSMFPQKFILYTESCYVKERGKPAVLLGSWKRGEGYASNIINGINHFVSGWIDWNLALDLKGGPTWVNNVLDSPIIINTTAGEFYKQPMFYAMGHFSKFVPEGSVRIEIKHSFFHNINSVGFLTPENNIVIILLNRKKNPVSINVYGSPKGVASFILPEKSIGTLIFKNFT